MYTKIKPNEVVVCPKCNGSGIFYGRGHVENGVFRGYTGQCFTCRGTGKQNYKDYKRCETYWNKYSRQDY